MWPTNWLCDVTVALRNGGLVVSSSVVAGVERNFWPMIVCQLFRAYFASQSKEIKFGDYFFDVCCAN